MTETIIFDVTKNGSSVVAGESPKTWTTWEGKKKTVKEIDHQHLSNIYWFNILLYNRVYLFIVDELKSRFNSALLPYRPDVRFENELRSLKKNGFLVDGKIYYQGNEVGEVHEEKKESLTLKNLPDGWTVAVPTYGDSSDSYN